MSGKSKETDAMRAGGSPRDKSALSRFVSVALSITNEASL